MHRDRMVSGSSTARLLESRVPTVVGSQSIRFAASGASSMIDLSAHKFSKIIYRRGFGHQARYNTESSIG